MTTKKRLIDANALKYERVLQKISLNTIDAVPYWEIEDAPTVEAVEVVHGKWIGKPIAGFSDVRCSVCGVIYTKNRGTWVYCPYCGAKMDGGI